MGCKYNEDGYCSQSHLLCFGKDIKDRNRDCYEPRENWEQKYLDLEKMGRVLAQSYEEEKKKYTDLVAFIQIKDKDEPVIRARWRMLMEYLEKVK